MQVYGDEVGDPRRFDAGQRAHSFKQEFLKLFGARAVVSLQPQVERYFYGLLRDET